jgi:subtilisin family serine protease
MKQATSILLMALILVSCDGHIDDQTIMTKEQYAVTNPRPLDRDFVANNARHKVIIAIMDSGVDYNHPYLLNNLHFSLDNNGLPTGVGFDNAGMDTWPAPYVARTNYFNETLPSEEREKSARALKDWGSVLQMAPELAKYFPLERNINEENDETFDHGTHVAGLASYDSPEIGIRAYRVIPMNEPKGGLGMDMLGPTRLFADNLIKALKLAISEGATVINLSLAINLEESSSDEMKSFFTDFQNELNELAENNPEVMFVAASGNEKKWLSGSTTRSLPCLIPKKNVICVGALTADMSAADFTNVVNDPEITSIYTWGNEILSSFPTNSCHLEGLAFSLVSAGETGRAEFVQMAKAECTRDQRLRMMSGTSMASPIIARQVAKLMAANPHLSLLEIKALLFGASVPSQIGDLPVSKLSVEKPSWYAQGGQKSKRGTLEKWNFFVPRK